MVWVTVKGHANELAMDDSDRRTLRSSMVAPPSAASAPSPAVSGGSSDAMDITNFTRMFSLVITLMVQSRGQSCGVIDA